MKLHLPLLMEHLESRDILVAPSTGLPFVVGRKDKRPTHLLPLLHRAEKFIFDSGQDRDPETTAAVHETAINMLEAGLFHLPHNVTWIEDPFEHTPEMRYYYLCKEDEEGITVIFLQGIPKEVTGGEGPRFCLMEHPAFISFNEARGEFEIIGAQACDPIFGTTFGEAIYSLKKFIVCLNTADIVRERVEGRPHKASLPKKFRQYEHSIVRVPLDHADGEDRGGDGDGSGRKRRKHLVRGYMWGKNTRPVIEQRWIKPFFRGNQEVGEVVRDHYVVKSRR
jgi:hypothetical protein